jgi:ribonucleoside-triphosphate reductase
MSNIYVIKKTGLKEEFNPEKIHSAIKKSADRVLKKLTDEDFKVVSDLVVNEITSKGLSEINVSELHNIVEVALDKAKLVPIANSYRSYRNYKKKYKDIMDDVDKKSFSLRYRADKSNANADSTLVSTKRSLIYQEYSSGMYKEFFLNKEELEAMTDGYIYIHDRGSRLDSTHNCMLFDAATVMKGGFEFGNLRYTEPKSVSAAMDVLWDITMSAASMQYGGISIYLDEILQPYTVMSYNRYMREYKELIESTGGVYDESKADEWAEHKVARDLEQGLQAMEHKFSSLASSRGDYPFTSVCVYGGTDRWRKLIVKSVFKVRKGGQGAPGFKRPVLFPKIIFMYDDSIHGEGKECEDIFLLATDCCRVAQYPDMLSLTGSPDVNHVAAMWLKYKTPILPMGCRAYLSPYYERGGFEPADENDKAVFMGRFNIGAISLHLPMMLAKARKEGKDFYEVLDYYLELVRGIHCKTYDYLGKKKASENPLVFIEGGAYGGHLGPNDCIAPCLDSATASFGITALNELNRLYNGKSIYEDGEFPLEVMKHINEKAAQFKKEDHHLYAIYGTPAESLAGLQVEQFRKKYGIVEGVSDREYVSNSFHCHVTEDISPIEKMEKEYRFWRYFGGGRIEYSRLPIDYNVEAHNSIIRRAMNLGLYYGTNMAKNYCANCGKEFLDDNNTENCPECGSDQIVSINRVNGYLGYTRTINQGTRMNAAKMAEIKDRKSM